MATRMNMMKLLQEVRGFAQLTNRRPLTRTPLPLLLQWHGPGFKSAEVKRKKTIRICIQEPNDIPRPVPIKFVSQNAVEPTSLSDAPRNQ